MKYFKYKNMNLIRKKANDILISSLNDKIKIKNIKLVKRLEICIFILFFLILGVFTGLIRLIPKCENDILNIFCNIGIFLLMVVSIVFSAVVCGLLFNKLHSKYDVKLPPSNREIIALACGDIRKYYGLSDEYLLTKCYSSSNELFNNHDVCIFRFDDELRITSDVVNGYLYDKNIGCYSVKFSELKLYKDNYNDKRVCVIEFDDLKFIVGIRTYSYIIKLMNYKIYKDFNKRLVLDDKLIYFRQGKYIINMKLSNINKIRLSIPQYDGIPGSGRDYNYKFKVFLLNDIKYIDLILERKEEKEIVEFLRDKNIEVLIEYFDNKSSED